MSKTLVTGCAGFIGFHLAQRLVKQGNQVVGVDNLNPYYDLNLKKARLAQLEGRSNFQFIKMDLAEREGIARLFGEMKFHKVVHLAAQAGCVIRWRIPMLTWMPTWSASRTFWKGVVTAESSIWFSPPPVQLRRE